jgi:hypothetical protein
MSAMLSVRRLAAIANAALVMVASGVEEKPNVLVLSGDFGRDVPLLDRLRKDGVSYSTCFTSTSPAKALASWLTGSHELRAGVIDQGGGRRFIRPDRPLVSEAFKAAGYRTAWFGRWGLGESLPFRPEDRGFQDVLVAGAGRSGDYWAAAEKGAWIRRNSNGWETRPGPLSDTMMSEITEWLRDRVEKKERFFAHVNLPQGAEQLSSRLVLELESLGLTGNTIVVAFATAGRPTETSPDPVAPLVFRWPGHIKAGFTVTSPVSSYDGLPTLLDLCGVKPFKDWSIDGIDLAPRTGKEPRGQRTFFFHPGNWPADQSPERYKSQEFAIRKGSWRLSGLELIDLARPVRERTDLFETEPKVGDEMMRQYGEWWQSLRESLEPSRIILGDGRQPKVLLTPDDWWPSREAGQARSNLHTQEEVRLILQQLANPTQTAQVPAISGVWKVHAAREGHYQFTLRKIPSTAGPEESKALAQLRAGSAHIRAGRNEVKAELLQGATLIVMGIDLPEGPSDVEAWFTGQTSGDRILGAFFVTVERSGEPKLPDADWKTTEAPEK